jgi:hypothetical protein
LIPEELLPKESRYLLRRCCLLLFALLFVASLPLIPPATGAWGFDVTVQPSSQTIAPGMPTAFTVLVSSTGGFNAPVKLQLDNQASLPRSISAVFTPSTVTPPADGLGYAILVISTTTSTPTKEYTLTISGTGGGVTDSATVTLEVTTKSTFTVSASPFSQIIGLTYSNQFAITVTSLGQFSSSVSLTLDQVPYGVSYSFDPASVTPPRGSSAYTTLTLSVAADASPNVYALIIRASADGGLAASDRVHYSFVVVDVPAITGFQINLPSATQTIVIGQPVSLTVEVDSIGGFSSGVVLALGRVPSGLTYLFDPNFVTPKPDTPATSTLLLTAKLDATPGDYDVDVTGNSQGTTNKSTISLTIQPVTTSLGLTLALTNIKIGDAIPVSGQILPAMSGASINLIYTRPDGTEFTRPITASSTGAFSDQYIPDNVGGWEVRAEYTGDTAHKGSKSSILEFQVTEKTLLELIQENALWIVIGIIIVAALGLGVYMTTRRRGEERRGPPPAAAPTLKLVPGPPAVPLVVTEAPAPPAAPRARVERREAPPLVLPRKKCFNCAEVISAQAKFCDKCRAPQPDKAEKKYEAPPLIIPRVYCVNCGEVISAQAAFCDKCRAPQT